MKRKWLNKTGGIIVMCSLLISLVFPNKGEANAYQQEKFTRRFGEMTYHVKYYATFNLAANTEHVLVSTAWQEPECTVKASANLALGSLLGQVYRQKIISKSATRSVTREWRMGEGGKIGGAIAIMTSHYINGGNQRQFAAEYAHPSGPTDGIPEPF